MNATNKQNASSDEPIVRDVAALLNCSEAQARLSVDAVLRAIGERTKKRGFKTSLRGFGVFVRDASGRVQFKPVSRRSKNG